MNDIAYRTMVPTDYDVVFALWKSCDGVGLNDIDDSIAKMQKQLAKSKNQLKYFKRKMKNFTAEELVQNRPVFSLLVKRMISRIEVGDDIIIELL